MVHFDVFRLRLSLSSRLTLLSRILRALFSSLSFFFLLFLLLRDGWHWKIEDVGYLCLQGLYLVFNLFDGIWEVLGLGLLESGVDLGEVSVDHLHLVDDALLSLFSEVWGFASCSLGKLWLHNSGFELCKEVDPLSDFTSKPVPGLDWVANRTKGGHALLILLKRSVLTLAINPVDGGLKILEEGSLK